MEIATKSFDMLKLMHEKGVPWTPKTCTLILQQGLGVEVLKYAHENGAPWSADTITCAFESTALTIDCLHYAVENGCPWDPKAVLQVASSHEMNDLVEWIKNYAGVQLG